MGPYLGQISKTREYLFTIFSQCVPIVDDLKTFRPKIGNITFELQIGNFEMRSKNRLPLFNLMFRYHLLFQALFRF